jgi:hypothetical protein
MSAQPFLLVIETPETLSDSDLDEIVMSQFDI